MQGLGLGQVKAEPNYDIDYSGSRTLDNEDENDLTDDNHILILSHTNWRYTTKVKLFQSI